jgi:hypothetical protein
MLGFTNYLQTKKQCLKPKRRKHACIRRIQLLFGAGNETRTRDLYLGKVSLYQLSYSRVVKTASIIAVFDLTSTLK